MKTCTKCDLAKPETEFFFRTSEKTSRITQCKSCVNARSRAAFKKRMLNAEFVSKLNKSDLVRKKNYRATNRYPVSFILRDCRSSDKRKDRNNDLTREFVAKVIENPCVYCGDVAAKMSLDRIDNSLGHLQNNVVPSCVRCNLVRGQMPYYAWLIVAKGMKEARLAGLFGNWHGNIRKSS